MAARDEIPPGKVSISELQSALAASGAVLDPEWHAVYQAS